MVNKTLLALGFCLGMFCIPQTVFAATYYVSTTGSDTNPGTQVSPWKTIQKAANMVAAGDTVIIGAGTYNENVTISKSGVTGSPIIFRGTTSLTIVESNPINTSCLDPKNSCILGTITISGSQIVLKNMEVSGPPVKPGDTAGITSYGANNEISNNFIHNTWREGVSLKSTSGGNRVLNNSITYTSMSAIYFDGQNHLVEGNTITHSTTRFPDGTVRSGVTDADGIRFFGSGSIIRHNIIKDIYLDEMPESDDPHSDCFQTWANVNNITIDGNYCELENSTTYVNPMIKFFMLGRDTGTTTVNNIKIINNVLVSKSSTTLWTPIQIGNTACTTSVTVTNVIIANNTFVHTGSTIANFAVLLNCSDSAIIRNNIIYNFAGSNYSYFYQQGINSNLTISNNAVYNSSGTLPKGGAYPGDNISSIWMKDPFFVNVSGGDYRLQLSSPLINTGFDLSGIVNTDYTNTTRPQGSGYDIGAWEYMSGTVPPATSPPPPPPPAPKLGDANGDGLVNETDYNIWLSNYNKSGGLTSGDFNADNFVDGADYVIWLKNYGK